MQLRGKFSFSFDSFEEMALSDVMKLIGKRKDKFHFDPEFKNKKSAEFLNDAKEEQWGKFIIFLCNLKKEGTLNSLLRLKVFLMICSQAWKNKASCRRNKQGGFNTKKIAANFDATPCSIANFNTNYLGGFQISYLLSSYLCEKIKEFFSEELKLIDESINKIMSKEKNISQLEIAETPNTNQMVSNNNMDLTQTPTPIAPIRVFSIFTPDQESNRLMELATAASQATPLPLIIRPQTLEKSEQPMPTLKRFLSDDENRPNKKPR